MKLRPFHAHGDETETIIGYFAYCPGCKMSHPIRVPQWTFNGDLERPTFSPSLLCHRQQWADGTKFPQCHSFIQDGRWQFLSDCEHELAGQTVEIPEWKEEYF